MNYRAILSAITGMVSLVVAGGSKLIMILRENTPGPHDSGALPADLTADPLLRAIVLISAALGISFGVWYYRGKEKGFRLIAVFGMLAAIVALVLMMI